MVSVSAAFVAVPGLESFRGRARARASSEASARPAPSSNAAIGSGLTLAGGFRVVQAYEAHLGALPFVLEGEGARFQVDVLRSTTAGTVGVFMTEHLNLFVHGRGGATEERGARALGFALEQRVAAGAVLPALASFEERAVHTGARLHVDVPAHV